MSDSNAGDSSGNQDRVAGGYYYEPLHENGPYSQKLEGYFADASAVLANAALFIIAPEAETVASMPNPGYSTVAEYVGGLVGKEVGFYIDNITVIENNVNTAFKELNDANSWVAPDMSD